MGSFVDFFFFSFRRLEVESILNTISTFVVVSAYFGYMHIENDMPLMEELDLRYPD